VSPWSVQRKAVTSKDGSVKNKWVPAWRFIRTRFQLGCTSSGLLEDPEVYRPCPGGIH